MTYHSFIIMMPTKTCFTCNIRPKKNIVVFTVTRPTLFFTADPTLFFLENLEKKNSISIFWASIEFAMYFLDHQMAIFSPSRRQIKVSWCLLVTKSFLQFYLVNNWVKVPSESLYFGQVFSLIYIGFTFVDNW